MENPIEMDDLGGTTIFGNTHIENKTCHLLELGKIFKKSSDSLLCVLFLSGPTFWKTYSNQNSQKNEFLVGGWTTHLTHMIVKLASSSPIFGVKFPQKNMWVATSYRDLLPSKPQHLFIQAKVAALGRPRACSKWILTGTSAFGVQSWQNRGSRSGPVSLDVNQ